MNENNDSKNIITIGNRRTHQKRNFISFICTWMFLFELLYYGLCTQWHAIGIHSTSVRKYTRLWMCICTSFPVNTMIPIYYNIFMHNFHIIVHLFVAVCDTLLFNVLPMCICNRVDWWNEKNSSQQYNNEAKKTNMCILSVMIVWIERSDPDVRAAFFAFAKWQLVNH